ADGLATEKRTLHDIQSGSRTVVDVVLARAVPLEIVLVAADDGSPVTDALVYLQDVETGLLYDGGHGDAFVPDSQGRVRPTMLRPARAAVQLTAKGFVSVPNTVVDPRTQEGPFTLRLLRAKTISGRLVHADGTPAPGEWVRAQPAGRLFG